MPLNNPAAAAKVTSGSYAGDGAANRPLAHGLGKTPKLVFIIAQGAGVVDRNGYVKNTTNIGFNGDLNTVTAWTTTYFYVSNATAAFNEGTINYDWVAIA